MFSGIYDKKELVRHNLKHAGEQQVKNFKGDVCNKAFNNHFLIIPEFKKPFTCDICK